MEVYEVSQKDLHNVAQMKGAIRAGSTIAPERRAAQYAEEGFRGKLFVAKTTNMMKAEDALLNSSCFRHNQQQLSNQQKEPGYVYVIKGKKMY